MTTSLSISPYVVRASSGAGQFGSGEQLLLSLLSIGDQAVFVLGFIEQLSGVQSFAYLATGETATRTLVWEFRWKNSGGSFSSWLSLTNPMLAGIVPDEDLPFYIELRATRQGSDASGLIRIDSFVLNYTYNDQAVVGYGRISQENLHGDTISAFIAIIQSWVWQVNGADHYHVDYKPRFWDFNTTKPTIYLHGLTQLDTDAATLGEMDMHAQISIGIKPVKGKTVGYDQQLSRLLAVFNPFQYGETLWSFDFKGVSWNSVTLPQFGIKIEAVSGMQELEDAQAGQFWHEFTVSFALESNNYPKYNT